MSDKPVSKKTRKTARKSSGRDVSRRIEDYKHADKTRFNLPTEELAEKAAGGGQEEVPETRFYDFPRHDDLYLDPHLSWARKTDKPSVEVDVQPLHEHERIEPATIIEAIRKYNGSEHDGKQESLFGKEEYNLPSQEALEFYQHQRQWSNRLIAGDSLLVMNSLIHQEELGGSIQMVYMDPPYGIKYGSNFQPFADSSVSERGGGEELTNEVQTLKAYRDTWELGIHSYLEYLRDRLLVARELLNESGSCFVQIGDENVHKVAILMDEIFGAENRVATISFVTTGSSAAKTLSEVADYILWYAKDKKKVKYRQLYEPLTRKETVEYFSSYVMVEEKNGLCRQINDLERFDPDTHLPEGARIFRRMNLLSKGSSGNKERVEPYWWDNRKFNCPADKHWSVSKKGLDNLKNMNRLVATEGEDSSLSYKLYEDEVPGKRIHNIWVRQHSATDKRYVVETAPKIIERCMLMTTDAGDLVVDPTCGSGTTAFVAEKWGRRWITTDTSRVAIALAKHRLVTAVFDYYELADENIGVGGGFKYIPVKSESAGSLAYNNPKETVYLFDSPTIKKKNSRVTGPFTVEAVPSPVADSIDDVIVVDKNNITELSNRRTLHAEWLNEIKHAGIQGKNNQKLIIADLKSEFGKFIHGKGKTADGKNVLVSFGPKYAALSSQQVERAIEEGYNDKPKPDYLIFAAFAFDEKAKRSIDETKSSIVLVPVRIDTDLQTKDLKKKQRSSQSFWFVGKPEVKVVSRKNSLFTVKLCGFDHFDVRTGGLVSGNTNDVVMWMLDPDYDGRSLYPRQVFFPRTKSKLTWKKLEKNLRAKIDIEKAKTFEGVESLPFYPSKNSCIAVKVITNDGVESMTVKSLPELRSTSKN